MESTNQGGPGDCSEFGCGAVYKLSQSNGQWSESALYLFQTDTGNLPWSGVFLDSSGNAYGTTPGERSKQYGHGLSVNSCRSDTWSEMDIYDFPNPSSGSVPGKAVLSPTPPEIYTATTIVVPRKARPWCSS